MNNLKRCFGLTVLLAIGISSNAEDFAIQLGNVVSPGIPGPGAGNLPTITSTDNYTFNASAGQLIYVDQISVAPSFAGYLFWDLKAPSGATVFNGYFDNSDLGRMTLPETGTYTLHVRVSGSVTTRIGDYSFALRPIAPDQTFAVQVGDTVSNGVPAPGAGNIESPGAQDVYTFQATAGQLAFFEQISAASSFAGYLMLQLKAPDGKTIFNSYFDSTPDGRYELPATGTYTLRVYSSRQDMGQLGTYSFRVRPIPPDQAFAIAIGQTVSDGAPGPGAGNIEVPGAEDHYTFQGTAGQNVFLEQLGAAAAFKGYLLWEIQKPSGPNLVRDYMGGSGTIGRQTLPETGTYIVRVYVSGTDVTRLGTYSFRIRDIPPDPTFSISIGQTVSNGVPGPGAGNIEVPGAQDFYTFQGAAGQNVFFDQLTAAAAFQGYLLWETIAPSGANLFRSYLGGSANVGRKTLPETGTYTIRVYLDSTKVDRLGTYSFRTYAIGDASFGINVGTVVTNGTPAAGAGNIEVAGEQDLYKFPATAGQRVVFEPLSVASSFQGFLWWEVKSPSGVTVVNNYLEKGHNYTKVLPESGTYSLLVYVKGTATDRVGNYSFRTYSEVFAQPDHFLVVPGKAVVIPVSKLMCNDRSEAGDVLTVSIPGLVSAQGATLATNTTHVTYTPKPGFLGTDTFPYRLAGIFGDDSIGQITVLVTEAAAQNASIVSFFRTGVNDVQVCLFGDPSQVYNVESSTDLNVWQPAGTVTSDSEGSVLYQFTCGTEPHRYFRFRKP